MASRSACQLSSDVCLAGMVAPSDTVVRPVVMMTTSFVAVETWGGAKRKTGDEYGIAASQAATQPPRDAEKISSKLDAVRALQELWFASAWDPRLTATTARLSRANGRRSVASAPRRVGPWVVVGSVRYTNPGARVRQERADQCTAVGLLESVSNARPLCFPGRAPARPVGWRAAGISERRAVLLPGWRGEHISLAPLRPGRLVRAEYVPPRPFVLVLCARPLWDGDAGAASRQKGVPVLLVARGSAAGRGFICTIDDPEGSATPAENADYIATENAIIESAVALADELLSRGRPVYFENPRDLAIMQERTRSPGHWSVVIDRSVVSASVSGQWSVGL
ncbi:MAG: hypothetical protein SGPRY_005780 [Prymnesium sp.]